MTSRTHVENAMQSFLAGTRPPRFRESKFWFVLGPKGEMLPAKAIWSLVTGVPGAKFNTTHAVNGLSALEFSVIDTRHIRLLADFDSAVASSLELTESERKSRLANAKKIPMRVIVASAQFVRNPDVVAQVLFRAAGRCERCREKAPFNRRKDDSPYLEVHHKLQLSQGGEDSVENAIALCPNCHRFEHFGKAYG